MLKIHGHDVCSIIFNGCHIEFSSLFIPPLHTLGHQKHMNLKSAELKFVKFLKSSLSSEHAKQIFTK